VPYKNLQIFRHYRHKISVPYIEWFWYLFHLTNSHCNRTNNEHCWKANSVNFTFVIVDRLPIKVQVTSLNDIRITQPCFLRRFRTRILMYVILLSLCQLQVQPVVTFCVWLPKQFSYMQKLICPVKTTRLLPLHTHTQFPSPMYRAPRVKNGLQILYTFLPMWPSIWSIIKQYKNKDDSILDQTLELLVLYVYRWAVRINYMTQV